MTVRFGQGAESFRVVQGGDRYEVTFQRGIFQAPGVFVEMHERISGSHYAYPISPAPVGADRTAVIDVKVRQNVVATVAALVADIQSVWLPPGGLLLKDPWGGPEIVEIRGVALSDLRPDVAPGRRTSREVEVGERVEQESPLAKVAGYAKNFLALAAVVAVGLAVAAIARKF